MTRPEKDAVVAHAETIGAEVVLARPATVSESFLAGVAGLASNDIVLIGLPDTIWEPLTGYRQPVAAVRDGADVGIGLFRIDESDLTRSDVVAFGANGAIEGIAVKPAEPPSEWIWAALPHGPTCGPASTGPSGQADTSTCCVAKDETCAASSSRTSGSTSVHTTRCDVLGPTVRSSCEGGRTRAARTRQA